MKKTDNSNFWAILGGILGLFAAFIEFSQDYSKKKRW